MFARGLTTGSTLRPLAPGAPVATGRTGHRLLTITAAATGAEQQGQDQGWEQAAQFLKGSHVMYDFMFK